MGNSLWFAVNDFIASLVHELRTPLTALRGSLGLMSSLGGETSADVRDFTTMAARNAAKLSGILDDVAAFVRARQPDVPINRTPVDLTALLEGAAEKVQPLAEERSVTVSAAVTATDLPLAIVLDAKSEEDLTPLTVMADETLLREAVTRLVFYAVRVTPKEGRVMVSAEVVSDRVVIRVADQGRAVRDGDVDQMFAPFSSVARRGVDSADRAGLDLAIAKVVAERHEGTIEYRQITGGGVVRLTLGTSC